LALSSSTVHSRELRNGPTVVRLQRQPFEILCLMLEHRGTVVTREQLRRRLWPDGTFVDYEHSINAAVKRLRTALGDDAVEPKFVETVPRRGYRLLVAQDARPAADHDASRGLATLAPRRAAVQQLERRQATRTISVTASPRS
jgi:DNA-binding winged helix-turn-helix (wHTH) protein